MFSSSLLHTDLFMLDYDSDNERDNEKSNRVDMSTYK